MIYFNKVQKVFILITCILLLLNFLFPPWKSSIKIYGQNISKSIGYKFILSPPKGVGLSIDLTLLLLQTLIILLASLIIYVALGLFSRNNTDLIKDNSSIITDKNLSPVINQKAKISDKELKKEIHEINYFLGIKWLKFWNYISLPIGSYFTIFWISKVPDYAEILGALSALQFILIYGLHYRYLWAWKWNWFIIITNLFLFSTGQTEEIIFRFLIGTIFWLVPNYIYWKKRKILFLK
jgi:hypothetical protein